jgi:hypothetical protein
VTGDLGRRPIFHISTSSHDLHCSIYRPGRSLYAGSLSSTMAPAEKVRPQLLSLRQLGRSRLLSARGCWKFSPVLAAISDLSSGLQSAKSAHSSPNRSFLSEALDSTDSVRFSKLECFERLMNASEIGFCSSSRTGKSNRFRKNPKPNFAQMEKAVSLDH